MKPASFFFFAMILLTVPLSIAQTKPAEAASPIRNWFKQLDDKDPEVRDSARMQLMNIPRSRLDELKRIVSESRPLSPAQVVELRPIVMHVFLTGEPYPVDGATIGKGFLGVGMHEIQLPVSQTDDRPDDDPTQRMRVIIARRMLGFPGFAALRDGDVIQAIVLPDNRRFPERSQDQFSRDLGAIDASAIIRIEVERGGKTLLVEVRLAQRPATNLIRAGENQSLTFFTHREELAADYWDANFGKLLGEKTM